MAILYKLMEKKDLHIYIMLRKEELSATLKRQMRDAPPQEREFIKKKLAGRIKELGKLWYFVSNGKLKEECQRLWDTKAHGKFHLDYVEGEPPRGGET